MPGLLPKRMSRKQKMRANKSLKSMLTPKQEIKLNLDMMGPLKKNQKFIFTKSGPKRIKK